MSSPFTQATNLSAAGWATNLTREDQAINREMQRERWHQRGRQIAGFVQRDMRSSGQGFVWEQVQAPAWPEHTPDRVRQLVDQATQAERSARAAYTAKAQEFALWAQAHPTASPDLQRIEFERLTIDAAAAGERAATTLTQACQALGELAEVLDRWQEAEQAAPAKRTQAERVYQQALRQIDTELSQARAAALRLGVAVP